MWLIIGAGMITLLAAAVRQQKKKRCRDYSITIKGKQDNFFVDEKDILQLLMAATKSKIKGQALSIFNLRQLEQLLEENSWIRDAGLYFDNRDILHVTVSERDPVARIFTDAGASFYIDSAGMRMPLSGKMSARVTVFTGFPDKKMKTAKDSVLLHDVKTIAQFIAADPFWKAQVSEVDITDNNMFEMIPVVGNHVVNLGNGEEIASKFHRLFVFYDDVQFVKGSLFNRVQIKTKDGIRWLTVPLRSRQLNRLWN